MWILYRFNAVKLQYEEDGDLCFGMGPVLGFMGAGSGGYFEDDRGIGCGGVG